MGKIIYIDNKLCSNIEQLRPYFNVPINYGSNIFMDILDYGRSGDLSSWLREHEENELALNIDDIDSNIGDGEYISRITDIINNHLFSNKNSSSLKPEPLQCFKLNDTKIEEEDNNIKITVCLNLLQIVNEYYDIQLKTSSGIINKRINPYCYKKGVIVNIDFDLSIDIIKLYDPVLLIDGEEIKKIKYLPQIKTFRIGNCDLNMIKIDYSETTYENREITKHYYISETLVTQALWKTIMGDNPCDKTYDCHLIINDNKPIVGISFNLCMRFIDKLNNRTQQNFRLPIDSEWYYASLGGQDNANNDIKAFSSEAWFNQKRGYQLHEVAKKKPNNFGLYDMYGNVWEYLYDNLILRGGCFSSSMEDCISIYPHDYEYINCNTIGFRLILSEDNCVDFVDLGLSVLWARNSTYISEFKAGARLPSVDEANEILQKCEIEPINTDSNICKITGPNKNYIFAYYRNWYATSQDAVINNCNLAFILAHQKIDAISKKQITLYRMVCNK